MIEVLSLSLMDGKWNSLFRYKFQIPFLFKSWAKQSHMCVCLLFFFCVCDAFYDNKHVVVFTMSFKERNEKTRIIIM
jgi:hypothetical protein